MGGCSAVIRPALIPVYDVEKANSLSWLIRRYLEATAPNVEAGTGMKRLLASGNF